MTFPANYAVIAEDELTYVTGGSIVDVLPNLMTVENWKTLGTNIVKIVGNTFVGNFTGMILGTMFGGNYAFGNVANTIGTTAGVSGLTFDEMTGLNKFMQVLGGAAAVYTLGTDSAVTKQDDSAVTVKPYAVPSVPVVPVQ